MNHLFGSFHGSRFHASERNWSIYGQIKPKDRTGVTLPSMPCYCPSHVTFATRARAQLRHDTADKLVFCHVSIHLRDKLQTAGYKEEVEKWDSDEESDEESDDDEDFAGLAR